MSVVSASAQPSGQDAGGGRRVAGSVALLTVGEIVNKLARFVAIVLLTRALPLDEFGLLNLGVALAGIAVVITRLGLPDLGARDIAIDDERSAELVGRIVTPQATALLGVTSLACAIVLVLAPDRVPFVALCGAGALGLALSADWLLRGMERMRQLAVATALGGLVALAGAIVVAAASHSALAGLGALAIADLAAAAWTWRSARMRRLPRPTLRGLQGLLAESWPLAITGAVTYAYLANVDTVLLAATRSTEEAGLYSAPYRLFLALNATAIFAAYALLPTVARKVAARAEEEAQRLILSCLPPLAGLALLCLGTAELVGGSMLSTLFGTPFGAMDTTFILLCAALPWYAVGYPAGYAAIAGGHQRRLLAGASIAAMLNIGLNVALIPPLGPEGAAVATTIAMIAAGCTWLAAQHLLGRMLTLIAVIALATAAAAAASLVHEIRAGAGIATIVVGFAVLAVGGTDGMRRMLTERRARR
jgi:O-antigen/teichoic acid export membrane protein